MHYKRFWNSIYLHCYGVHINPYFFFQRHINADLPVQLFPVPIKPGLQEQLNPPSVFVHICEQLDVPLWHSLISEKVEMSK
jgi:hypothetical protein